jgi:hypothetical protein
MLSSPCRPTPHVSVNVYMPPHRAKGNRPQPTAKPLDIGHQDHIIEMVIYCVHSSSRSLKPARLSGLPRQTRLTRCHISSLQDLPEICSLQHPWRFTPRNTIKNYASCNTFGILPSKSPFRKISLKEISHKHLPARCSGSRYQTLSIRMSTYPAHSSF